MSTRAMIAAELAKALGDDYAVQDYPWTPAPIPSQLTALLSVERLTVEPAPSGVSSHFRETYRVWVMVQGDTRTDVNENDLDDALDATLEALARIDVMSLQTATRTVVADQIPAYGIDITVHTNHD